MVFWGKCFHIYGALFFVELSHRPPVGNCPVYNQQLLLRIRKGEAQPTPQSFPCGITVLQCEGGPPAPHALP